MTYITYKKVFHPKHGQKLIRTPTFLHFSDKQCQFTQSFAKQPCIFLFLELFFTPKYTSPKVKNIKLDKRSIFFGTPCRFDQELAEILTFKEKVSFFELTKVFDSKMEAFSLTVNFSINSWSNLSTKDSFEILRTS